MDPNNLQILFEAQPGAERTALREWLRSHGLDPVPMKAGFLVTAELESLQKAIPSLAGTETGDLPTPDELSHHVRRVRVYKTRSRTAPKYLPSFW